MGVDKKTTLMLIKVDLQCSRCYKKIKKVLCRIPQIQDQVYNEKENCVLIKVVCCSPEKIKQKIICKGGSTVKSIEIIKEKPKEPEKPKETPKEKPPKETPKEKPPEKPKETPKEKPKEPETAKPKDPDKPKEPEKPKEAKEPEKPKEKPKETPPPPTPQCPPPHFPPPHFPPQLAYPEFRTCCTECYEGRGGGPCYSSHGRPPPCSDGYYGRPIYDSYGGGGGYRSSYGSPCDYFSEENSSGCSIM